MTFPKVKSFLKTRDKHFPTSDVLILLVQVYRHNFFMVSFQGYSHPVSPNQENMLNSGLPPMSTFRGQPLPPSSATYTNSSSTVTTGNQGQGSAQQQTGDALGLGKALASVSYRDCLSAR